jgi:hypothetical protein
MRDIDVAAAEQSNQFLMKQFANLVSKERLVDGAVINFWVNIDLISNQCFPRC